MRGLNMILQMKGTLKGKVLIEKKRLNPHKNYMNHIMICSELLITLYLWLLINDNLNESLYLAYFNVITIIYYHTGGTEKKMFYTFNRVY